MIHSAGVAPTSKSMNSIPDDFNSASLVMSSWPLRVSVVRRSGFMQGLKQKVVIFRKP